MFDVHALVGAEIQPLIRQPISSAQSIMTDVAPRGLARTLSVEGVQATRPLFTQPEGRTVTDRCLAIRRGRATPSGAQGRPTWRIAPGKRQAREEESRGGKKTHSRSEPGRGDRVEARPLLSVRRYTAAKI